MPKISIVEGVGGFAMYFDDYRVAGPKPLGGGRTVVEFQSKFDCPSCDTLYAEIARLKEIARSAVMEVSK